MHTSSIHFPVILAIKAGTEASISPHRVPIVSPSRGETDMLCKLAVDMECYRLKKYIGSYMAVLNKVDALSFTGGVGENSSLIREKTLENLEYLGIEIDKEKNRNLKRGVETEISASSSKIKVFVIPTDEEIVLTEDVIAVLDGKYKDHSSYIYSFL